MSVFESRLALQPADQVVPTIPFSIVASDTDGMNYGQGTDHKEDSWFFIDQAKAQRAEVSLAPPWLRVLKSGLKLASTV